MAIHLPKLGISPYFDFSFVKGIIGYLLQKTTFTSFEMPSQSIVSTTFPPLVPSLIPDSFLTILYRRFGVKL
jgi:hypothetical protein